MLLPLLLLTLLPLAIHAEYPCPDGQYNLAGACRTPICLPIAILLPCATDCPIGQYPAQNMCVPKPHCPDNQAAFNGTCLPVCGPTELPTNNQCVVCTPPYVLVNGVCKKCPPGTRPTNNQCPFDCPENMVWGTDRCVSACGWNEANVNGSCQRVCPGTQYLYGTNDCRDTCDNGLFYHEELCVEVCPAGAVIQFGNVCTRGDPAPFG